MQQSWWVTVLFALSACFGGGDVYIVEGTVLEVTTPTEVIVKHQAIAGYMGAMTMPFGVDDPSLLRGVKPGDRIYARLRVADGQSALVALRVTGSADMPIDYVPRAIVPIRPGSRFPPVEIPVGDTETWTVGNGHVASTVLTFIYTRCPMPDFCPATIARLQELQAALPPDSSARIVAVTLDPDFDSVRVLDSYAELAGAHPARWRFGRLDPEGLQRLAMRAGLGIIRDDAGGYEVVHGIRLMVIDAEGRLVERYDDNRWPTDRVVSQLVTGDPPAPPGIIGSIYPE